MTSIRIACIGILLLVGCGRSNSGRSNGSSGPGTHSSPSDGASGGPVVPRVLRRAQCGALPAATLSMTAHARDLRLAWRHSGSAFEGAVPMGLGGWVCLVSYEIVAGAEPAADGVGETGIAMALQPERRRFVERTDGGHDNGAFSLHVVDPAWVATLREHADRLMTQTGAALAQHCAELASLRLPDVAAIRPIVDARVENFLATGSLDLPDAGGSIGPGALFVATIARRCGWTDGG